MKPLRYASILGFTVALAMAGLAFDQGHRLTYKNPATNPRIQVEGDNGFVEPEKTFELSGNVLIKQNEQKLTVTCAKAVGDFVKVDKKTDVDNVHLTGGVRAEQIGKKGKTIATGNKADYGIKGALRYLNLTGSVRVDFAGSEEVEEKPGQKSTKTSNTVFTASAGELTFQKVKGSDGNETYEVQTADVTGPIQFDGTQVTTTGGKTTHQKLSVSAKRLTFERKDGGAEIKLSGDLVIHQEDDGEGPEITGAQTLVATLNEKNEIVKLVFSSEGIGKIKTVYKGGKGGE
ncbi:MAG: hypothetical protein JST12_11105 [Armatimonadetes bacterium]|nr:hypothetical protein [Armatimonadota bacterium]